MVAEKTRLPTVPAEDTVEKYLLGLFREFLLVPVAFLMAA